MITWAATVFIDARTDCVGPTCDTGRHSMVGPIDSTGSLSRRRTALPSVRLKNQRDRLFPLAAVP
jgi:hypothetical protein